MSATTGPPTSQMPFLDWAIAGRPRPGEQRSGDIAAVWPTPGGCVLTVVDGLGHGPEAARAADLVTTVVADDPEAPLEALFWRAHERLVDTRGAAATIAILDGNSGRMDWLGVGNVDGVVIRADEAARPRTRGVFLCRGVLGYRLPTLHMPEPVELVDGDSILIATDGITGNLGDAVLPRDIPAAFLADRLLEERASAEDDALVFVAHFRAQSLGTIDEVTDDVLDDGAGEVAGD